MTLSLSQKHILPSLSQPVSEVRSAPGSSGSYFLHPGQVYVAKEPQSISLVLGSCVAVCVWELGTGIGGATHYLLPTWDGRGTASPRYGNVAIPALLQKLIEAGARRDQLRAKVFGGGCLFDQMREGGSRKDHLGMRNAEVAKEILTKERIRIVSSELGGDRGKRIVFQTNSGEAIVKEL